jgi:DNA modification methylase
MVATYKTDVLHHLKDINWSFSHDLAGDRAQFSLLDARRHHWYPATYIPEVPYTLLELLSRPGDRVLDPFAGIGTTLWQALVLDRRPFGIEVSFVAYKTMEAILTLLHPSSDIEAALREVKRFSRGWDERNYLDVLAGSVRGEMLRPWFTAGTYNELAYLSLCEQMASRRETRALLSLSVSAVLKSVCEQRRGWGCVADNMRPKAAEMEKAPTSRQPIARVVRKATATIGDIRRVRAGLQDELFDRTVDATVAQQIIHADAKSRSAFPTESFGLAITSPPYPGMTDYATSQRLSYYWHGRQPEVDVEVEIGARRKRFKSGWLADYVADMEIAMSNIASALRPGGQLVLVLPEFNLTTEGEPDSRAIAIGNVLDSLHLLGLEKRWEQERLLPGDRRHQNQRWARLQRERLYMYSKESDG